MRLLEAEEAGEAELLAPGTILPEGFNAVVWQQKRGLLDDEDAREAWQKLLHAPIYTYATEDLIERAAEISNETGAIVYDALFSGRWWRRRSRGVGRPPSWGRRAPRRRAPSA